MAGNDPLREAGLQREARRGAGGEFACRASSEPRVLCFPKHADAGCRIVSGLARADYARRRADPRYGARDFAERPDEPFFCKMADAGWMHAMPGRRNNGPVARAMSRSPCGPQLLTRYWSTSCARAAADRIGSVLPWLNVKHLPSLDRNYSGHQVLIGLFQTRIGRHAPKCDRDAGR